jgi:hypothetical protein
MRDEEQRGDRKLGAAGEHERNYDDQRSQQGGSKECHRY